MNKNKLDLQLQEVTQDLPKTLKSTGVTERTRSRVKKSQDKSNPTNYTIFFTSENLEIRTYKKIIRHFESELILSIGFLEYGDIKCSETYLLEINYDSWLKNPVRKTDLGIGAGINHLYAEEAKLISEEYCRENGLKIFQVILGVPKYQVIVYKERN